MPTPLEILLADPCPPLRPGRPAPQMRDLLAALDERSLAGGRPVADAAAARACLAGLWLGHGFLDESHRISQELDTAEGSWWHGIMHRCEGDFSNADYWFRRVGAHPLLAALGADLRAALAPLPADPGLPWLTAAGRFDPHAFTAACQAVVRGATAAEAVVRTTAAREWRVLFDHCHRSAFGAA